MVTVGRDAMEDSAGIKRGEEASPQLRSVKLLSSGWINKYLLTYELADGSHYEYESVSRKGLEAYRASLAHYAAGDQGVPDAVCIVPLLPDDSVLLIREFRYPVNAWCIAFPAGLVEVGELLETCVERELGEETGYCIDRSFGADALIPLPQTGFSSVGMSDENVQVVIAHVKPNGNASTEKGEYIEPFVLPRAEIDTFLTTQTDIIGTRCQLLLLALRKAPFSR